MYKENKKLQKKTLKKLPVFSWIQKDQLKFFKSKVISLYL